MKKTQTQKRGIDVYDSLRTPDQRALKTIGGGRLKGMTDIKPQWRIQRMTEIFGLCGFGWKYDSPTFTYQTIGDETNVICVTNLYIKLDNEWSAPIPGVGGSKVATKERTGVYVSDEAEKMSLTDALSVAMKSIGVAADIYIGYSDSKYDNEPVKQPEVEPIEYNGFKIDVDDLQGLEILLDSITSIEELRGLYAAKFAKLKGGHWVELFTARAKAISGE